MKSKELNRVEVWVAEHAVPIFLVIAALIVVGAIAVFVTWEKQGNTADKVHVIAPQVTRINRAICDKRSLTHSIRAQACAERIRIGLVNCRHVARCRAAYLALATYPPPAKTVSPSSAATAGGGARNPSHAGQQPGPGEQPGHHQGGSNHGGHKKPPPEPTPAPSPAPAPTPAPVPSPGNSGDTPGADKGVKACVEVALSACAEVDLGN